MTIENDYIVAEVSEIGAELSRLYGKKNGIEYLWLGDEKYWKRHSPILFPFVGGIAFSKYRYHDVEYSMTWHGIVKDAVFHILAYRENELELEFINDHDNYPFKCRLIIDFLLEGRRLYVNHKVINDGSVPMIYGIGSHPGFNIPLTKGLKFEDYRIEFPECESPRRMILSPDFLSGGGIRDYPLYERSLHLNHSLFDEDVIILEDCGHTARICTDKDSHAITIYYPGYRFCGIWHTRETDAPFVAIEPWSAMPGSTGSLIDIEDKDDFLMLSPRSENNHLIWMDIE